VPSSPEAWYDAWYFRHCCGRPYDRSQERTESSGGSPIASPPTSDREQLL
jgi:hypothetical protein